MRNVEFGQIEMSISSLFAETKYCFFFCSSIILKVVTTIEIIVRSGQNVKKCRDKRVYNISNVSEFDVFGLKTKKHRMQQSDSSTYKINCQKV